MKIKINYFILSKLRHIIIRCLLVYENTFIYVYYQWVEFSKNINIIIMPFDYNTLRSKYPNVFHLNIIVKKKKCTHTRT